MCTFRAFIGLAVLVSHPLLAVAEVTVAPTVYQGGPAVEVTKTVQIGNVQVQVKGTTNGTQADGSAGATYTTERTKTTATLGTNQGKPEASVTFSVKTSVPPPSPPAPPAK